MTFDTYELSGRAQSLNAAAERATQEVLNAKTGIPPGWSLDSDEVLSVYDDFLAIPSPDHFSTYTDGLLAAMQQLATAGFSSTNSSSSTPTTNNANTTLSDVGSSGIEVGDWTGEAADSYNKDYAAKFKDAASSQFTALYVLREAINAEAAVWQTVRDDLDNLSEDATTQMEHVTDCTQDDWNAALSVAGAVAAVGGAIPTGGASLAGWAVVGAGVTVASTGMSLAGDGGDPDEEGLDNGTPEAIFSSLKERLGKIKEYVKSQEDQIVEAMNTSLGVIDGGWKEFCLPRPALADSTQGNVGDENHVGHPA